MAAPTVSLSPAPVSFAQATDRASRPGTSEATPAPSFGALLEQVVTDAVAAGRTGEATATQALAGRADLQAVVDAVNAAELTLQTVVAVRDRMITAYQEIIRMPI